MFYYSYYKIISKDKNDENKGPEGLYFISYFTINLFDCLK